MYMSVFFAIALLIFILGLIANDMVAGIAFLSLGFIVSIWYLLHITCDLGDMFDNPANDASAQDAEELR